MLSRKIRKAFFFLALSTALLFSAATGFSQSKGNPNPGVLPAQSLAFGKSIGEWAAGWFSWVFGRPLDEAALGGQDGRIFYLVTIPGVNRASLDSGVAIFVPVAQWATIPPLDDAVALAQMMGLTDAEIAALTPAELSRVTAVWAAKSGFSNMSCKVDGNSIQSIDQYWFESGIFGFLLDPTWGCSGGDGCIAGPAAAAGYSFILAPLPPGEHVISYSYCWFDYCADITWILTVGKK